MKTATTRTLVLTAAGMATVVLIAAVGTSARIPGALNNVHAHERGCSVASLKGTYAFRRTGVNIAQGGPIAQIGIVHFSGDGTRGPARTTRSSNGVIQDWTDQPLIGSYTVDPDCTGSLFGLDGTKGFNIIVLDRGKRMLVLSITPGTISTEEVTRLEAED